MTVGFPFVQGSSIPFSGGGGSGALLGTQLIQASGTYVPTPGTNRVRLRMQGGGAGGGGTTGGAGQSVGAGGSGGVYGEQEIVATPIVGGAVTIPGAAAGGGAGADGSAGGTTSIVINGTTYQVGGGTPGRGMATSIAGGTPAVSLPGGQQLSNNTTRTSQSFGTPGFVFGAGTWAGMGGNSPFGIGGIGATAPNSGGQAGAGFGGGGGGAFASTASQGGGTGSQGCVLVEEYS